MALQRDSDEHSHGEVGDDLTRLSTHEDLTVGESIPKPMYSNVYGHMDLTGEGLNTQASITGELYITFSFSFLLENSFHDISSVAKILN